MNQINQKFQNLLNQFKETLYITELPTLSKADNDLKEFNVDTVYISKTYDVDEKVKDWYSELNTKEFDVNLNSKNKAFFYPKCSTPRYKVREWGKNNNLKITTKLEACNVSFISNRTFHSHFEWSHFFSIDRSWIIKWFEANYSFDILNTTNSVSTLYNYLCNSNINDVILSYNYFYWRKQLINSNSSTQSDYITLDKLGCNVTYKSNVNYYYYTDVKTIQTIKLNYSKPHIHTEDKILGILNENSVIIDEVLYENIANMFDSSDKKNHVIALETICNSNLGPSLYYILKLIRNYNYIINNLKEKNHINFKSLLSYLNITLHTNLRFDKIVDILIEKEELNENLLKIIAEDVKQNYKSKVDSEHFIIKTITVTDEIKNYFRKNKVSNENTQLV